MKIAARKRVFFLFLCRKLCHGRTSQEKKIFHLLSLALSIHVDSVKNDAFKVVAKPTAPDLTIMHLPPFQETDLKPMFVRKTNKVILFRFDGCRDGKVS
jgi:hypothetical protein